MNFLLIIYLGAMNCELLSSKIVANLTKSIYVIDTVYNCELYVYTSHKCALDKYFDTLHEYYIYDISDVPLSDSQIFEKFDKDKGNSRYRAEFLQALIASIGKSEIKWVLEFRKQNPKTNELESVDEDEVLLMLANIEK